MVHLVRENATSEEWAAKCMQTAEGAAGHVDRMTKADIENECEILKMMDHPSICKLHEHFEINGGSEVVMVMELLSGGDLLESVINNGTYCEADAREIFSRVLDGVAHIHQRGVAHRDLKVENLMLKRAGDLSSVKIIDLGMAVKVKADHEKHGERKQQADDELIRGTPEYMVWDCTFVVVVNVVVLFLIGFFFSPLLPLLEN